MSKETMDEQWALAEMRKALVAEIARRQAAGEWDELAGAPQDRAGPRDPAPALPPLREMPPAGGRTLPERSGRAHAQRDLRATPGIEARGRGAVTARRGLLRGLNPLLSASMISVVIPTLNAQAELTATLSALVPAAVQGLVREVIVADGGSSDDTGGIADVAGADFIRVEKGRGAQLAAGAEAAKSDWLLFLHADTVLQPGWEHEVAAFIERVDSGARPASAAAFAFALNDFGARPRLLEGLVRVRCALFRIPYGDQGLLIPRHLYASLGGYRSLPLMEDVDIVRRLGRGRVVMLRSKAMTSAARYKREGYFARMARNMACLSLYYMRVPPATLVRLYG